MNGIPTRLAAASGAVFVVAVIAGNALFTTASVEVTDGASALVLFQRDASFVLGLGSVLEMVGFAAFLVFLGHLYRVLRRAEGPHGSAGTVALGGGLIYLAIKMGSIAPVMAGRLRSDDLNPDVARALVDLSDMAFVVSGLMFGLFCAVAAAACIAHSVLPRWLGWTGLVIGLLTVGAGATGIVQVTGFNPMPFVAALAWTLMVSVALVVRARRPLTDPGPSAPAARRADVAGAV